MRLMSPSVYFGLMRYRLLLLLLALFFLFPKTVEMKNKFYHTFLISSSPCDCGADEKFKIIFRAFIFLSVFGQVITKFSNIQMENWQL